MAILGNIFLVISALIFIALFPLYNSKMPGGDAGVGYAWSLIMLHFAFVVCMIIAALFIGGAGGFEWVSADKSKRFLRVAGCLVAILITWAISGVMKNEAGPPIGLSRIFSGFVPYLIPVILIGTGVILVNSGLRTSVPVSLYKWPLVLATVIGVVGVASGVVDWVVSSAKNQMDVMKHSGELDDNQRRILADIDSCDVSTKLWSILVFTGDNQIPEIQQKAVAKVKTNPEWQAELIRMLDTDGAPEVFQFLASNDVDDPSLFAEPIREGIMIQARLVRERIRNCSHPSHFYPGMFMWDVERVVRTVDKFEGKGVDYLDAMKELRVAMDEPSDFDKPKFTSNALLDKWIKKHSK